MERLVIIDHDNHVVYFEDVCTTNLLTIKTTQL